MTAAQTSNFIDFVQNSGRGASELHSSNSTQSFASFQSGDLIYLDVNAAAKGGNGKGGPPSGRDEGNTETVTYTYITGQDDMIDDSLQYNIEIQFLGDWTDDLKAVFIASADYLSSLIDEGITSATDSSGNLYSDLTITADLADIDGSGGVLGQAGPTAVWIASELTALGEMTFDQADAQDYYDEGSFDDIVLHEMMHVMGFGTLWTYKNNDLVSTEVDDNGTKKPIDDTITSIYTGVAANSAYTTDEFLFVETDGGSGTAGSHWDELIYNDELMTGYIGGVNPDGTDDDTNYLSDWSVASLEDLGYVLIDGAAGIPTDVDLA